MSKRVKFLLRFSFYVIFALVIPASFLVYRFKLFQTVTKTSIGGWGIVFILLFFIFFLKLFKQLKNGMKFSIWKQIIDGICGTILPLLTFLLIFWWSTHISKELMEFLCVLIVCELVAIPVNPIPGWAFENNKEIMEMSLLGVISQFNIKK